ncbi:hypothetical protein [Parvibaculum sp.]|jgi:hypothetical protein|uniref:hypothetical protein n=1 Tax=Parvibaculum sp. TaxID=2024848 RepID=UPI000C55A348|nr:hypothetical protein [Parvibaculum sp.]MAV92333.1 hypothetical protein [Pseudobdellovibrionaceae bacterium]MAU59106.1 hypothetical protein [Parvibaculum sp.]MBO6669360.1 hypothetical protein [Parvibaculum sp.]MBO6692723.1 hypothetical protein [Parvibaculum sp.]MBO6715061.1 hypothetical protein [Parvibaculum sp.]|tara:strand:- start:6120 stop:6611 length:492 start_codon:yes stop_codon:yes gene_type:complete
MSMNGPDSAAANARSNLIRLALVVLAMTGVIAFYLGTGRVDLRDPVEVTARVTQPVTWTQGGPLSLDVAVTLTNNTDEPLPLSIASQCDIFQWFVADEDMNLVQSQRGDEPCVDVPMRGSLDANHKISGEFSLSLDPARVKPGDYILFIRYWGHELRQPITID